MIQRQKSCVEQWTQMTARGPEKPELQITMASRFIHNKKVSQTCRDWTLIWIKPGALDTGRQRGDPLMQIKLKRAALVY